MSVRGKELLNIYLMGDSTVIAIGADKSLHVGVVGSGIVIREHRQDVLHCLNEILYSGRDPDEFDDVFSRVAMVEYDLAKDYATIDIYPRLYDGDVRPPNKTLWIGCLKNKRIVKDATTLIRVKATDGSRWAFASLVYGTRE